MVSSDPDDPQETERLIEQLERAGATDELRAWAQRDETASRALQPRFAAEGATRAQRKLIEDLLALVRNGSAPLRDELGWMDALRDPEFFDPLFEILRISYTSPRTPDESAGWQYRDVITPTISAIANIGTREAVRRYGDLLAVGGALRWLRPQRDRVAGNLLRELGSTASVTAARVCDLPDLMT